MDVTRFLNRGPSVTLVSAGSTTAVEMLKLERLRVGSGYVIHVGKRDPGFLKINCRTH